MDSGQILLLILSIGLLATSVYVADWQPGTAAFVMAGCSYLMLFAAIVGRQPAAISRATEQQLVAAATLVVLAFLVMLGFSYSFFWSAAARRMIAAALRLFRASAT